MARTNKQLYPDFTAFIDVIDKEGITPELLSKIIQRHRANARYNEKLYKRYQTIEGGVTIYDRQPTFEEEKPINNKINNDFFGEIVNFETGYFAGQPISYGYSSTEEAEEVTGGVEAVDRATKALTDFVVRNNMYSVDMETTKNACIYGYSGRLLYIDTEGNERVMPVHGYETIILSKTDISEPKYAIRYYKVYDINNVESWIAEFYDNTYIYTFKGQLSDWKQDGFPQPHMFDYCPLQGIEKNAEKMGSAEKVISLIDDYDKVISDNSNEIEAFVHSYMVWENIPVDENTVKEAQKSGAIKIQSTGTREGKVYFLTKQINDSFTEHHLQRTEDNIYRFSQTPNLADDAFGTSSGVALKFKLHGLETKCGMFEAKMLNASQYMFKVLASAWRKKGINFEPLQVTLEFKRNFPLDSLSEAQTAQAQIAAGLPQEWVYGQMSNIDDVDYIMELKQGEQEDAMAMYEKAQQKAGGQPEETEEDNEE